MNDTVTEILAQLSRLKAHADSVLGDITGIINKTYDDEMRRVDEEVQNVQSASALAMSAQYNGTAHKNMSANLNNTALESERNLLASFVLFNQMRPQIDTVTTKTNEALVLINQTKVCFTTSNLLIAQLYLVIDACMIYNAVPY